MSKLPLTKRVQVIVSEQLRINVNSIVNDSELSEFGADSLNYVEIIMDLENSFGIQISDCDADRLKTVDAIVKYLIKREVD